MNNKLGNFLETKQPDELINFTIRIIFQLPGIVLTLQTKKYIMLSKSSFLICLFICLCFNFTTLYAQKANEEAIPAEFKCPDCVLIILKKEKSDDPKFNQNVEKGFKNYSGKFEMVDSADLGTNSKYQDKKVYRFILKGYIYSMEYKNMVPRGQSGYREVTTTKRYLYFQLYDRELNKEYPAIVTWGNGLKTVEKTADALDKKYK